MFIVRKRKNKLSIIIIIIINPVHSGPNKRITDNVNDGPFSNQTGNNSNAKSGPKMKHTSKKAPRRKYYRPSNDTKTFQINNKGHLQCLQDP